jgi:hypothetical protein
LFGSNGRKVDEKTQKVTREKDYYHALYAVVFLMRLGSLPPDLVLTVGSGLLADGNGLAESRMAALCRMFEE